MSDVKINWNDFRDGTQHELRKTYKIGYGRQADVKLERAIRNHLDGANATERREFYDNFYRRK